MRLGISNSYLSEIESGKKSPSLELLDKYSDIFNIPVSSLILFSETLDDEEAKLSKRFKVKSTQLILKILDWSNTIESTKQRKA